MEYCDGGDLAKFIRDKRLAGGIKEEEALFYII